MFKRIIYVVLVISILVLLVAYSNTLVIVPKSEALYQVITLQDVKNPEIKVWVNNNYKCYGYYQIDADGEEGEQYLLIAAGEMNTGGYSLEIVDFIEDKKNITFKVKLNSPGKDEIVTMALTYPYLLLKVKADDRKINVEFIDFKGDTNKTLIKPKIEDEINIDYLLYKYKVDILEATTKRMN